MNLRVEDIEERTTDREQPGARYPKIAQLGLLLQGSDRTEIAPADDRVGAGHCPSQQRVCDESLAVRRPAGQPQFTRSQSNASDWRQCGQDSWVLPKRVGHQAPHQVSSHG
jgi:hypothetical protein